MTDYELLEAEAVNNNIDVVQYDFQSPRIKGLYCDGVISISPHLSNVEKADVLAEELGHYYTSCGNILDPNNVSCRKQEQKARLWAYDRRIGLSGIIRAYEHGCQSFHETADYLEVTEEFLSEAIKKYQAKYGLWVQHDEYVISFADGVQVGKMI
ncbi:MAG TPA: hypothetical protein DF613_09885 [Lachnospiraceae bacterium]|nr:hypothetical protein [Lachnospiraceae bacterium]